MRGVIAAALLLLTGCGEEPARDWNPLELPAGVEEKLKAAMGAEEVEFMVSPPNDATRTLGWVCGLVGPKVAGSNRFFVYEKSSGEVRLQPEISPSDGQSAAFKLAAFMEYKRPCEEG